MIGSRLVVAADDKIPYIKGSPLEKHVLVRYLPGAEFTPENIRGADALIVRTRTHCGKELLAGSDVKFIATATIGFDHIDAEYCGKNNIFWTSAPGCNAPSVAQYIVSLLLTDAGRNGFSLKGKTLGIVGCGHVGTKVLESAKILGMNVLLCDPPRAEAEFDTQFLPIEALVKGSDYLTFHVPLVREGKYPTFHLADGKFLSTLRKNQFLINTSRGEVVEGNALKQVLSEKKIRGAALDVWENEPEIDNGLLSLLDFATPHIAGYSADGKANGSGMSVRALSKFFGLKELENWNPEAPEPEEKFPVVRDLLSAVRKSYDILTDDSALRKHPECFEKLRGDYRLRREFQAFTITGAKRFSPEELSLFENLGFRCLF